MADNIIDLVYYAIVSALSTWLYYDRLSRRRGRLVRRRMILAAMLIFVSHLVLFIPASDGIMTIFYIGQIVFEFYVVVWIFDEKIINKLIAYIEVNVAIGIGMTAGYAMLRLSMDGQSSIAETGAVEKILFYIVTLTVTGIICFMLSYVDKRKDKADNLKGIEASVVICIALLCILYAVGMTMVELKDSWKLLWVYGYFVVMTVMVMIILYLNKRIQQNEDMSIREQVQRTIHENMQQLDMELKNEAEYYNERREWLEGTLLGMYDNVDVSIDRLIKALVAEKAVKAEKSGVDIEYKLELAETGNVHAYDAISIYSNLLDNAIRAAGENVYADKQIKLDGIVSKESFYLVVENSYETPVLCQDGEYMTTKADRKQHGLGIRNVRAIAEKYDMTVDISTDNNVFKVVVQG